MKYFTKILLLLCLWITLASCQHENTSDPDVSNVKISLRIKRIDKELFACQSQAAVLALLQKYPDACSQYFNKPATEFPALAQALFGMVSNPALKAFYAQSQQPEFFGNQLLENDFTEAFQHIKHYYPSFKEPTIYVFFTGFYGLGTLPAPELQVHKDAILLGLDYFMGKKGKYVPDVYSYQLEKMYPQTIVPQTVLQLSLPFNQYNTADKTLLGDMIWYGKSYVFAQTMMPSKADSVFIRYTGKQLDDAYDNQSVIWAHFIDAKLLYNTQDPVKGRYIGERPSTPEIASACPGEIGRWLGYRIVSKYFYEDEKLTIQDLMKNPNAQQIFEASGYKGLPDEE